MIRQPLISVLMSTYIEPTDWLHQSIDSILNQTFKDIEFIIICDNPKHIEAVSLLRQYAAEDSRIVLLFNEENIGLTRSLNKGLQIAKGKYIARMDADDVSDVRRLQVQYDFMEANPDITICGTGRRILNGDKKSSKRYNTYTTHHEILSVFVLISAFVHSTVLFRRDVFDKGMRYDETAECVEDYDLWERMIERGYRFANIDQPLISYRESGQQVSRRNSDIQISNSVKVRRHFLRYCGIDLSDSAHEKMTYPFRTELMMTATDVGDYAQVLEKLFSLFCEEDWFNRRAYQTEAFRFLLNTAVRSSERIDSLWRVFRSPLTTPYSLRRNLRYYLSRL